MAIDGWLALAAGGLLLAAALVSWASHRRVRERWLLLASGARIVAGAVLAAALVTAALGQGQWSPFDRRQVVLSLAWAVLVIDLAMVGHGWKRGTGPAVDLIVLALALAAVGVRPGALPLACAQRAVFFYVQWALLLLGAGGVVEAGAIGVMFAVPIPRFRPDDLEPALQQVTALALMLLGSGLAIGVYWASRTAGTLAGGDPRQGWMAVIWLLEAISLLAWRLGKAAARWAAVLAVLAALAVLGFLVAADLRQPL